jgi:hypothetical protein
MRIDDRRKAKVINRKKKAVILAHRPDGSP